jgi:GNAT superfamily N-acetyltransferase
MYQIFNPLLQKKLEDIIKIKEKILRKKLKKNIKIKIYKEINEENIDSIINIQKTIYNLPFDWRKFYSDYDKDINQTLIIIKDNNPLGYINNCSEYNTKREITDNYYTERISVIPSMQNKGIGKILLDLTTTIGKKLNFKYHSLTCSSVNINKQNLINYYLKQGFKLSEDEKDEGINYMRRDAIKYSLI